MRRGIYNGYKNQNRRPNKDSSESFTSVDSNFEPMLVSSPVEKPKGRNSGLPSANSRNSPKTKMVDGNRDNDNEIENGIPLSNGIESRKLRNRDNYESKDSRQTSKQNDVKGKDSYPSSKLPIKQSTGQDSDISPDSSPVKPQNQSQTLFTQRALRKMNLSKEIAKDKANKSSSPQRKLTPERKESPKQSCDRNEKSKSKNELKKDTLKNKEHDEINDRQKRDRNKKAQTVHKDDKSERKRKDEYDKDNDNGSEVKTTKVVDLREKLRLKRQLKDPPDLTKQSETRVSRFNKRRLSSEDKDDSVKRRKYDNETNLNDDKVSVEVDTTVSDEEIKPKSVILRNSVSKPGKVEKDRCADKIQGATKSKLKERSWTMISYSETDSLDTETSKTNTLFKTLEQEKAAKAEVDRLKRLMEGSKKKVSASCEQTQCLSGVTDPSLEVIDTQTEVVETLEETYKPETLVSSHNEKTEIQISDKSATKLDAEVIATPDEPVSEIQVSFTEEIENKSENSDFSMLYANIGEVTLESSGRSAVSDNFDVEIFRPAEGEKDHVSSSSTNVVEKYPSQKSPVCTGEGEPLKDSFEITSTVSEEDNVVNPLEERCEMKLNENTIGESTNNLDGGKKSGENLTLTVYKDKTESAEADLAENNTEAKDMLQNPESNTVNETSLENLRNSKMLLEKSQLSSSFDTEPDDVLNENGVCVSKRRKKKKHKKDRRRRKSKSNSSKLSNQSSVEDLENEICDQTEKMTITPERISGFEKSPALSKQSSMEKQSKSSSRTPKSVKDTPGTVFRGVISETVSATTSNVIDNEEVFLSPARPLKSKRRSKSDSKVENTPVKIGDREVHETCDFEKEIQQESKIEKSNHDSDMALNEKEDKNKESQVKGSSSKEEIRSSLSGTSVSSHLSCSDGSFGSNILSEKTSSLSLSSDTDLTESSFSSQTSGTSFISASTTSDSGTSIEESTELDVSALTESQSCEKLANDNKDDNTGAVTKVDEHMQNATLVAELVPIENKNDASDKMSAETLGTDGNKADGKTTVTESNTVNMNDIIKVKSPLKSNNLSHEKDIAATHKVQISSSEVVNDVGKQKYDEVTKCVEIVAKSKRKRHHTDGCLNANSSIDTKGLHKRTISVDRSLLLQCLLNEITSICDKPHSDKDKTKKKIKSISYSRKRSLDNLKTSTVQISDRNEIDANLQKVPYNDDQTCVQDSQGRQDDDSCEMSELETSQSKTYDLQNKTITNDIEEKEGEILSDKTSRNREVSAEELVFGSWTGLSIAVPKSEISSSLSAAKSDITLTELENNSQTDLRFDEEGGAKGSDKLLEEPSKELLSPLTKEPSSQSSEELSGQSEVLLSQSPGRSSGQSSEESSGQSDVLSNKSKEEYSSQSSEEPSSQSSEEHSSQLSEESSGQSSEESSNHSSEKPSGQSSEIKSSQSSKTPSSQSSEDPSCQLSAELSGQLSAEPSGQLSEHNIPEEAMETETCVENVDIANNQETTEISCSTQIATIVPDKKVISEPVKSNTDSNPYFEVDEQPDFLNTMADGVSRLPESSLKSSLNSSSVSSVLSNTIVMESEATFDTLSASGVNDVEETNKSMNVTFDFVNYLKKSPHKKVKMVKRTSPSKLKSNTSLDTTKTSQSNCVKNDPLTYTGSFTSPVKLTINPLKSISADSILTSILNRNVTDLQQKLESPSKEYIVRKAGDTHEDQMDLNTIDAMKEKTESSDLIRESVNTKQLENPVRISEQIGNDTNDGRTDANIKMTTKPIAISNENKTQKEVKTSDTVKKQHPVLQSIPSSKQSNEKLKGKAPRKKCNERVPKHSKQAYGDKKSSVSKSNSGKESQKPVTKEKTSPRKTKQAVTDRFDSKSDIISNGKEKLDSSSPLRSSPRKKCNVSSVGREHLGSDSSKLSNEEKPKENQNKSADRGYKTQQKKITNEHPSLKEKADNLQKTPSKAKYVSIFDESPAKNTRSATKLNAEKPSVNTKEKTESNIIDKTGKRKLQTSCKKNLAFSKDTSTTKTDVKGVKQKSDGVQRKLQTQRTSSKETDKLKNKAYNIRPNAEVREPVNKSVNKSKNSIKSTELYTSEKSKSDCKVRSLIENRNGDISIRKSQGYTDLLKTSRKESASTKTGTVQNKQVSEVQNVVKSNRGHVPKNNSNIDRYNVDKDKVNNNRQKEKVSQTSVNNEITKTNNEQTVGNKAVENNIVGKISETTKVIEQSKHDIEQLKDTHKGAEIRKSYRIPKLKSGQQKEPKTSDPVLKTSNMKNQFSKPDNRSQLINSKVGSKSGYDNSNSVPSLRKQSFVQKVSDKPTETEKIDRGFADILSESDLVTMKQSKGKSQRQKSGQGSSTLQDKVKYSEHLSKTDCQNRKSDANVIQTDRPQKANTIVRNDNGESVKRSNLYAGVGERTSKFGRISYDNKLISDFENDRRNGNTDNSSEHSSHELARVRQGSQRPDIKTPKKRILDKINNKSAEWSDETYREQYDSRKTLAETHTSESEFPRTESDSYSSSDSDADKDTDSDKESDMTDRTPVLNRMLFGSDSSGDESTGLSQCDSPAKIKTIPKYRSHVDTARCNNSDSSRVNKQPIMKELTKRTKGNVSKRVINKDSNKDIETEVNTTIRNTDKHVETVPDNIQSSFQSSFVDYIDEKTQCSLLVNTSSDTNFKAPKARHVSGILSCGADGVQNLSSSIATSTSGTLLLDCEDTLDHTDYVDSLLHEKSLLSNTSLSSNTSKSDLSYHDNSSHGADINESLEEGEVMSSDNEAVKSSPLKPKRIPEKHGISGLVSTDDRLKMFSPVKFPEKGEMGNSEKSNYKTKSVRISEVWKECLVGRKNRDSGIESGTVKQLSKDVPEKGLKDDRRRKARSCSHSPRRQHTTEDSAITDREKPHTRTPKSRTEASASSRRRSTSRSPRPSRRSRSHSPRGRRRHRSRSFSRSPRRRHIKSRSRSRERKDYSRCRHKIPEACSSKSNRHRSPLPVTPHRSRHRHSPPRHRNTSPYYRSRRNRSRSPSGSPCYRRRSRRDTELDSPHHHKHSECDKGRHKASHCCEIERKETCSSKTCCHGSKSDTRGSEQRSRNSPEHNLRHSHRHGERSCQKRKRRSHSCSSSGRSRSKSREKHDHKPKRQRANLSKHFDYSSEEND